MDKIDVLTLKIVLKHWTKGIKNYMNKGECFIPRFNLIGSRTGEYVEYH